MLIQNEKDIRVLVCGGRDYYQSNPLFTILDELHQTYNIIEIIQGGAQGADQMGARWAIENGVKNSEYKANWRMHGKSAGMIRNKLMLHDGKPHMVVACPGGRGTANMKMISRQRGIKVIEL